MNISFKLFVTLLSLSLPIFAFYDSETSKVISLTTENWGILESSPHAWLVEFYAPWCGHCKNLAPVYEQTAEKLQNYIKVAAVNADENPDLVSKFQIQGFPSVKIFPSAPTVNPYTHKSSKMPKDFVGHPSVKGFVDFALQHQPSFVKPATRRNIDELLNQNKDGNGLNVVLSFTNKDFTTSLLKGLSTEFKDRLIVAEVKHTETDVCTRYEVTTFPTLLVVKPQDGSVVKYQGDTKFAKIAEFLSEYASAEVHVNQDTVEVGSELVIELTSESFHEKVEDQDDPWIVAFTQSANLKGLGPLAAGVKGLANVGIFNCAEQKSKLCNLPKDISFPFIKSYSYGSDQKIEPKNYPFDEESLKQAKNNILESFPATFITTITGPLVDGFLGASFQTKSKSAIILLSEKEQPSTLFRAATCKFKGTAGFGFISNPDAATMSRFGIKSLPMILGLFPSATKSADGAVSFTGATLDPKTVGGGFNYAVLDGFISQITKLSTSTNASPDADDGEDDLTNEKTQDGNDDRFHSAQVSGDIPELTAKNFNDLCGKAKICAITILDGNDNENREQHLNIVKEVRQKKSPSPFQFSWVDGTCQLDLLTALDISPTDLPTMITLVPSSIRFARLIGRFDVNNLGFFLGGIMGGKTGTKALPNLPNLNDIDCVAFHQSQLNPVAEEDDIMAQIIAEEKARLEEEEKRREQEDDDEDGGSKKKKKKGKKGKAKKEL